MTTEHVADDGELRYRFGRNWRSYVDTHLNEQRIARAMDSLREFLETDDLRGRSFLDIGCGSGLFSLAAHRLGADRVHSFDFDEDSVACCRLLRERAGSPENWVVHQGSVLDRELMSGLGSFDIVYSWGVLHHTGDMWTAIRNAAGCVAPGGRFYIAIYNSADAIGIHADGRVGTARFWERAKRIYCRLPAVGKLCADGLAATGMVLVYLLTGRNPVRAIRSHESLRGMSWMVDLRDWFGGYPYEHATVEEIFRFGRDECGMQLLNLHTTNTLMNNEFLFGRPASGSGTELPGPGLSG